MSRKRDKGMENARAVIDELFDHPPVSEAELSQRISGVDPEAGRRILMERLHSSLAEEDFGLFIAIFQKLGIGSDRDRLMALATDKHADTFVRSLVIAILAEADPTILNEGIKNLDPEDIIRLADHPLMELVTSIESIPANAQEITKFLLETPEITRPFLLNRIGLCRRQAGVSAVAVYADALSCADLAELHEGMIDAIIEEGGQGALDLLTKLRDQTAHSKTRGHLQSAILRLGTRAIDPKRNEHTAVPGSAYVGSCDGQGAFFVVSVFRKPNGTLTAADLCIRAAADVRDGFVVTRQSSNEVKSLLNRVKRESNCAFASVSLEQAAWVVADAVERTRRLKVEIPADAVPAINLLRPLFEPGIKNKPVVVPVKSLSLAQIRRVLARPVYDYWFFEIPVLIGAGVNPPPKNKEPSHRWFEAAARKLDQTALRERVVGMAWHMAYWHAWRGEEELASQCAAMGIAAENDFVKSGLVRVMLERSLAAEPEEESLETEMIGTPGVRQYLKSLFFNELVSPTGKELALLDLTEVAIASLERALAVLPGERRPREDRRSEIAFAIANESWKLFSSRRKVDIDRQMDLIVKEFVKKYGFKKRESLELIAIVVYALTQFAEEICSECPFDCYANPTADMSAPFFSPHHPMASFLEAGDDQEQLELDELWSGDDDDQKS
jgi:hypothetical protein